MSSGVSDAEALRAGCAAIPMRSSPYTTGTLRGS
jgi:hypothetical protein